MPLDISPRSLHTSAAMRPFLEFHFQSSYTQLAGSPDVIDFTYGNPNEMAIPGFSAALQTWSEPRNESWYAYKLSEPKAQRAVVESLKRHRGLDFEPDSICMTNGGFAAISLAINTLVAADDEVIFNTPPWFFYDAIITNAGGVSVRVRVRQDDFDLDLDAIEAAITPKTRAVLVNSPNNPTGRIYPEATLKALADILERASARIGRRIYLLSDEAYSRIIYDNNACPSPTSYYPYSLLLYTYGKTLLTPGQRIGFIALPSAMPDRDELINAILTTQISLGWLFPNALLQHALGDLENLSIDLEHLQAKRDLMVGTLREIGYEVHNPASTFYLLPKSPIPDDRAFCQQLAQHKILVLPGAVVELPGYFRISLTANDDMIKRSLSGFEAAFNSVHS